MFEVSGAGVGGSFLFFSGAGVGCLLLLLLAGGVGCLLLLLLAEWLLLMFVATASGARLWVSAVRLVLLVCLYLSRCTSSSPCACPVGHPS